MEVGGGGRGWEARRWGVEEVTWCRVNSESVAQRKVLGPRNVTTGGEVQGEGTVRGGEVGVVRSERWEERR